MAGKPSSSCNYVMSCAHAKTLQRLFPAYRSANTKMTVLGQALGQTGIPSLVGWNSGNDRQNQDGIIRKAVVRPDPITKLQII